MALNVEYRPESLDEVVGNEALVESLKGALNRENPKQTFLFTGPSGCGKTTFARIVKSELKCSDWDFHYFNASNTRGIDTIREVIESMHMAPMQGHVKVFVFDECHQLTRHAQEALLKDTEEPPSGVYFVFCTTEPEKLQITFKRRAFQGQVERLLRKDIVRLMKEIFDSEIYEAEQNGNPLLERLKKFPEELFGKIADVSDGSPGQALKLLDQIMCADDYEKASENLKNVFGDEASILDIGRALTDTRLKFETKWRVVKEKLAVIDAEPESVRRGILTYLSKVVDSAKHRPDVMEMISYLTNTTFDSGKAGLQLMCYQACLAGEEE
jgi:DNA polymerase III gamma/tau subunit